MKILNEKYIHKGTGLGGLYPFDKLDEHLARSDTRLAEIVFRYLL